MKNLIAKIKRYFRKHADQRYIIHVVCSDGTHRALKWSEFNIPKVGTGLHPLTVTQEAELFGTLLLYGTDDSTSPILNYFEAELLAFRLNRMRSNSFVHVFSYATHRIH